MPMLWLNDLWALSLALNNESRNFALLCQCFYQLSLLVLGEEAVSRCHPTQGLHLEALVSGLRLVGELFQVVPRNQSLQ